MLIDVIHQKMPQFQDLRMKDIVVHKREGIVNLVMSYPKTLDQEVQQQILALCQDQVGSNYKVNLTFQLDNMTTENAKKQFFDYIKQFAFALMNVKESQVKVSKNDLLFVFDFQIKQGHIYQTLLKSLPFLRFQRKFELCLWIYLKVYRRHTFHMLCSVLRKDKHVL